MKSFINCNFEQNEEKKEIVYIQNNYKLYSEFLIDKIIHDLKQKGFNNSQMEKIIISFENYHVPDEWSKKYIPINRKLEIKIKIGAKLRIYNSFINETGANNKNFHSYYNAKTHLKNNLNEINNKNINDKIHKNKSNITINISKINNTNSYVLNTVKNNDSINQIIFDEKKDHKKITNIPCDKNKRKIHFNNNFSYIQKEQLKNTKMDINRLNLFYYLKYNKEKIIEKPKNKFRNSYTKIKLDNNIYAKKKKPKISSINTKYRSIKDINDKFRIKNFNKNNEVYSNHLYQTSKVHKQSLTSSHLIFQRKILKNMNKESNINYNAINEINNKDSEFKQLHLNIKKTTILNNKSSKKFHSKKRKNNHFNNHSFYNTSYINIKSKKNYKLYSTKIDAKLLKIYKYHFNNRDKNETSFYKTKSYNNTSERKIIHKVSHKSKKIDKNNIKKITKSNKTVPIKVEKKLRDRNIFKNSFKEKNWKYENIGKINDSIIRNKNNKRNKINIHYCYLKNIKNRNNSEIQKKNKIQHEICKTLEYSIEGKNNILYYSNGLYQRKIKKEYQEGKYEGFLINNKRELIGVMYYNNGSKYEGQWKNDKKHGKGIFTSQYYNNPNLIGIKYEGEFSNDKIEGYGIGNYTSGDRYEGEWKNNKQYGRGILIYKEGGKYVGEWKNGKLDGNGIYYLKNGERFEGNFIDDKYNGYGKYYYNDGEYLEGIFKNDFPTGICLLHKIDGTSEERDFN